MSKQNYNITDHLDNPEVQQAIILGTLQKTFNKIQVGKYNILAVEFNLDKVNKHSLKYLVSYVEADGFLNGIYESAMTSGADVDTLRAFKRQQNNEGLFKALTPYAVEHQDVLANNREFSKIQREGAYLTHLVTGMKEELRKEFPNLDQPKYVTSYKPAGNSKRELIVCLSDWHIGAFVNNIDTGGYNFSVLTDRLKHLISEVGRTIKEQNIRTVHVYHIGDLIEHINMRNVNQAFEAEFPATEQMAKGIRILSEVLNAIASTGAKVTFGMTGGNHDRFQGNKNDKIYNDNVAYLVLDQLFFMQELGAMNKKITLIDNRADVYSFLDTVAGKRIKVVHGDAEGKKTDVKIPRHIKNEVIDYLIMGHIHTTRIIQEDFSRFHVYVGSPMGANNYSAENNLPTTSPAQLLMVLDPKVNSPMFMPIFL